jgi:hypothetical protein
VRQAVSGAPVLVVPLEGQTDLRIPLRLGRGLKTVVLLLDRGEGVGPQLDHVTVLGLAALSVEPSLSRSVSG